MDSDRTMKLETETEYILDRNFLGSSRLYFQHYLWERLIGHLLHPSIPIKDNLKIADIACGTGIWLLDLAKELAKTKIQAQLDGFDISTAQYPPAALLPGNIRLATLDIFEPIPEELKGRYDVIHISLLCCVIHNGDPRPVLDNLLMLLKPGGYIQWKESDFGAMNCTAISQEISTSDVEKLVDWAYEFLFKRISNFDWIRQLGSIFQERGITLLHHQILDVENDIAYAWTTMNMNGMKELVIAAGGSREAIELHRRAAKDVQRGACITMSLLNVVGRKAGGG